VLQKGGFPVTNGHAVAAMNVQAVLDAGVPETDMEALKAEHINQNMNNVNHGLLNTYFDETVEAITWLNEQAEALDVAPEMYANGSDPCLLWAPTHVVTPVIAMAGEAERLGAVFHYNTPGVRLATNDEGTAVVGAIGQAEDGSYIQVNAAKGVVLACGDYGNNPELVKMWCPMASYYQNFYQPANNTGDGFMMAKWIGAQISPYSHTKMAHVHHYLGDGDKSASMRTVPWMNVDAYGKRFMNEAVKYEWRANAVANKPGNFATQIFDSTFNEDLPGMGQAEVDVETLESYMETLDNCVFKADTIEGLAIQLDVDPETLAAEVARYNELVASGHDDDFGKDAKYLYPIDTPPFYAIRRCYTISAIMGGLQVDETSCVLNENDERIEGLYAAGNMQGGLFGATDYSFAVNGMSLGRAATFGYYLGRELAK
jgi:succinate dehydrogenase/fumarate reductase flavoprotein subunit